jgi:hypothetical protein
VLITHDYSCDPVTYYVIGRELALFLWGRLKERDYLEDLGIDESILNS